MNKRHRIIAAALVLVTLTIKPVAWTADTVQMASPTTCLAPVMAKMRQTWPKNLFVNLVLRGHSVPAVDSLHVYPNLLRVALDGGNCGWSRECIGLPSVVKSGGRLAIFYDAAGGDGTSHMKRDAGPAWLNLPLTVTGIDSK